MSNNDEHKKVDRDFDWISFVMPKKEIEMVRKAADKEGITRSKFCARYISQCAKAVLES